MRSLLRFWWKEWGKWQVIITAVTLISFVITLKLGGAKLAAVITSGLVVAGIMSGSFINLRRSFSASIAALTSIKSANTPDDNLNALTNFAKANEALANASAAMAAASVATTATITVFIALNVSTLNSIGLIGYFVLGFGAFIVALMQTIAAGEMAEKITQINKEIIWFSYVAEFLLILIPILLG